MRQYVQLLKFFHTMGNCRKFGYVLWATAENLVMGYGPLRGAMGDCAGFGFALWATAQDLVLC